MTSPLFGWLSASSPDNSAGVYSLISMTCAVPFDDSIKTKVSETLVEARINETFLAGIRARLTKDKYQKLLLSADPIKDRTRKGDFGEIVAAATFAELLGYYVPVKKLRYKIHGGDQQTGIDVVAFKIAADNRSIVEVCYTESKLRTSEDLYFGVQAHDQLDRSWRTGADGLHVFLGGILADRCDPVLDSFYDYLDDASDVAVTFCLALHSEEGNWRDKTLEKVKDLPPILSPLTVCVYRIPDLANTIKSCFNSIGVADIDEEDD